jgi:hypothetical protein
LPERFQHTVWSPANWNVGGTGGRRSSNRGQGARWFLWADSDLALVEDRDAYPLANCESSRPKTEAASRLLHAYWQALHDRYNQDRFEEVLRYGILDFEAVERVETAVWGDAPV